MGLLQYLEPESLHMIIAFYNCSQGDLQDVKFSLGQPLNDCPATAKVRLYEEKPQLNNRYREPITRSVKYPVFLSRRFQGPIYF